MGRDLLTLEEFFNTEGDGASDEYTFYSLGDEFFEAARMLHQSSPTRIGCQIVIYYLLGHAAELFLKCFLFKVSDNFADADQKQKLKELKNIGHDLKKLVQNAKKSGLPEKVSLDLIVELSSIYSNKYLEYRKNKKMTLPSLDNLFIEVEVLKKEAIRSS